MAIGLFGEMFSDVGLSMTTSSGTANSGTYGYGIDHNLLRIQQMVAQQQFALTKPQLAWTPNEIESIKANEDEEEITLKVQEEVKLTDDLFI